MSNLRVIGDEYIAIIPISEIKLSETDDTYTFAYSFEELDETKDMEVILNDISSKVTKVLTDALERLIKEAGE